MKLTKTSVHAVFAVTYLARQSAKRPTQARQVGEHLGVQTDSALKVLQAMVRQNLLRSQLGRSGGYRLLRDPSEITLLNIVEAIDGPIEADVPSQGFTGEATKSCADVLEQAYQQSARFLRDQLDKITVADLADVEPLDSGLALAG